MSDLSQIFEFNERDLAANRKGHMTERQKQKLSRKRIEIATAYGLLIMFGTSLLIYTAKDMVGNRLEITKTLFVFGFGLGICFIVGWVAIKWHQFNVDRSEGKVSVVSDKAFLGLLGTRNLRYKLQIGDVELEIPKMAVSTIVEGENYQVYYSPRSKVLLSIERL